MGDIPLLIVAGVALGVAARGCAFAGPQILAAVTEARRVHALPLNERIRNEIAAENEARIGDPRRKVRPAAQFRATYIPPAPRAR
jgi:hypothetical protein